MPARPLAFFSSIFHPGRQRGEDEEAPPQPNAPNSDTNAMEQSDSEADDSEEEIGPRLGDRAHSSGAVELSSRNLDSVPITRFRSLPAKTLGGGPSEDPGLAFNRTLSNWSLTLTSTSTDLTDYSAAPPPGKRRLWLQKAKNFIQQKGEYADDVDMVPSYRW